MGNLKFLKDNNLDTITNITDAAFDGDPDGTNCDDNHMQNNVSVYLKDLAIALQPGRKYPVGPDYGSLDKPFNNNIADAIADLVADGSGSSNIGYIEIENKATPYSEALSFSQSSGFAVLAGKSKRGTVITGTLTQTAGVLYCKDLIFKEDITINNGAKLILDNCDQLKSKKININGSNCSLGIVGASELGYIEIASALTSVTIRLERIRNMGDKTGVSLIIPNDLVTPIIDLDDIRMLGSIDDTGNFIRDYINVTQNCNERMSLI